MNPLISILFLTTYLFCFSGCVEGDTNINTTGMNQQIYTLGAWHVQDGRQQEFIATWKELGDIFNSLPNPPGKGILIQSTTDSTLFYSFGPWENAEAVDAMRNDERAREGIGKLMALCTTAAPGSFKVVAESP